MSFDIDMLNKLDPKKLTPELLKALKDQVDIVTWCENNLSDPKNPNKKLQFMAPGEERPYQIEMLRFQPKYAGLDERGKHIYINRWKIYRLGRRMGKCISANSRIVQFDGCVKTIEEMFKEQSGSVWSLDEKENKLKSTNDIIIFSNGIQPTYKLTTKSGRVIESTNNHPYLTIDGWKELKDFKMNEKIIIPLQININSTYEIKDQQVKQLANIKRKIISSYNKIEDIIYKLSNRQIKIFLETYFNCEDIFDKKCLNKYYYFHCELFLRQICELLLRLGIHYNIYKLKNKYKLELHSKYEMYNEMFYLDPIDSIEYIGEKMTYDLEVKQYHNFIANGILSHNSICLAAEMLYKANIQQMQKILFVGPMQYHRDNMFEMCSSLLQNSGIVPVSKSKNPMQITFANGSIIKFFIANANKSRSSGIRGQEADHLCFPAGTNINHDKFTTNSIENIKEGDEILGFHNKAYSGSVEKLIRTEKREVMKLTTPVGEIICTPDHPFTYNQQDIPAKDAQFVYFKKDHINLSYDKKIIEARLLGYILCNFRAEKGYILLKVFDYNKDQIIKDLEILGEKVTIKKDICYSKYLFNLITQSVKVGSISQRIMLIYRRILESENRLLIDSLASGYFSYNLFHLRPAGRYLSKEFVLSMPTLQSNQLFRICSSIISKSGIRVSTYNNLNNDYKIAILPKTKKTVDTIKRVGFCYNRKNQEIINKSNLFKYIHNFVLKTSNSKKIHRISQLDKYEIYGDYWIVPIIKKEYLSEKVDVYNLTTDKWAQHRYHANGFVVHNCVDEADYCGDEVLDACVLPIFRLNPKATMTVASTPSGRRGLFYKWCTESDNVTRKEFHFNQEYNPRWTAEAEKQARAETTAMRYLQEYDAEFGDEASGIFGKKYLDESLILVNENEETSLSKWYDNQKYNKNNAYIMGVDWNRTWGVDIIIVERDVITGKYKVWRHEVIERNEQTQTEAVKRIIDIHKTICHCSYIFIDKGFGEMQWETLKKISETDLTLGLKDRVFGIEFGGNIEYFDSEQRVVYSKPAKQFMIENAVLVVERLGLSIVELEERENGLLDQMNKMQYHVTSSGNVITKSEDGAADHSVMSLILALIGFRLKYEMKQSVATTPRLASLVPKQQIQTVNAQDNFKAKTINRKNAYRKLNARRNQLYRKTISSRLDF